MNTFAPNRCNHHINVSTARAMNEDHSRGEYHSLCNGNRPRAGLLVYDRQSLSLNIIDPFPAVVHKRQKLLTINTWVRACVTAGSYTHAETWTRVCSRRRASARVKNRNAPAIGIPIERRMSNKQTIGKRPINLRDNKGLVHAIMLHIHSYAFLFN